MKLDEDIVEELISFMADNYLNDVRPRFALKILRRKLSALNLVVKPGDSSQSTLVDLEAYYNATL